MDDTPTFTIIDRDTGARIDAVFDSFDKVREETALDAMMDPNPLEEPIPLGDGMGAVFRDGALGFGITSMVYEMETHYLVSVATIFAHEPDDPCMWDGLRGGFSAEAIAAGALDALRAPCVVRKRVQFDDDVGDGVAVRALMWDVYTARAVFKALLGR